MAKKDFVYFLKINEKENLSLAFCSSSNNTPNTAKMKIQQILLEKKIDSFQLSYLGLLDYHEMDASVIDQLHFFEKHGEVWFLF